MKMYSITLSDHCFRADGLGWYATYGQSCDVNGVRMVRMASGAILPGDNWFENRSDALRSAADQIERYARLLLTQAGELRDHARQQEGMS